MRQNRREVRADSSNQDEGTVTNEDSLDPLQHPLPMGRSDEIIAEELIAILKQSPEEMLNSQSRSAFESLLIQVIVSPPLQDIYLRKLVSLGLDVDSAMSPKCHFNILDQGLSSLETTDLVSLAKDPGWIFMLGVSLPGMASDKFLNDWEKAAGIEPPL